MIPFAMCCQVHAVLQVPHSLAALTALAAEMGMAEVYSRRTCASECASSPAACHLHT